MDQQLSIPSFVKTALSSSKPIQLTFDDVSDTNIQNSSSFAYDISTAPLKSTQQLKVDWSKFENHTFFSSAEAKVNFAFDQIINGYPFDGSRQETESFFEKLTGFENWVMSQFPTYKGELLFSGSYISVNDVAGGLYTNISKNKTGDVILNPKGTSFCVEMQIFVPAITNDVQVVFQKISGTREGLSMYLTQSMLTSSVNGIFSVASIGFGDMSVEFELKKNQFNHVCVQLNRETSIHALEAFVNEEFVAKSKIRTVVNDLNIDSARFLIGSGTQFDLSTGMIMPKETFNGILDEFRVFHSVRSIEQQRNFAKKSIFSTPELKLYYRFNEPPPPIMLDENDLANGIVIDSSGNSLHALVTNFTGSLRLDASQDALSNMIFEKKETIPVLFPAYAPINTLCNNLLASASLYDAENPNLITKLVPSHYLLEGAAQEGFNEINELKQFSGTGLPGQGTVGNVQIMLTLLYIWAKFFDEIKLYIDAFRNIRTVSYSEYDVVPDNFMLDMLQQRGIYLPPLFNDSTIEQYIRAENIDVNQFSTYETSLKAVQHELMKRVLVNLPDILKSKGTQNSIKSFLRAIGIDPDNSMRLREYGGPTNRTLEHSREQKRTVDTLVKFTSSSIVTSPFLVSPRIEPGNPIPSGTFITDNGRIVGTTVLSDNLLTSGSWTCDLLVKFPKQVLPQSQSIVRMCTTGSIEQGTVLNIVAVSGAMPTLTLYARPGTSQYSPLLSLPLQLTEQNVFDNQAWNVSFGIDRNTLSVSSSYFLRIGKQNAGEIDYIASTASYFLEDFVNPNENIFNSFSATTNASGSFFVIGGTQQTGTLFLEDANTVPTTACATTFTGYISNFKFWTKAITEVEWREHVKNIKSVGVDNPAINYNFNKSDSGSFERLRIDTLAKQESRTTDQNGNITFLDFTLNNMHFSGSGFLQNNEVMIGEVYDFSMLSPYFDEAVCNDKVRSRSYTNVNLLADAPWAQLAPVHEIAKNEQPTDDVRFSVEFSLVDALNRDIVTVFSTLDAIGDAIGSPENAFSTEYSQLSAISNVYFNRIQDKLNFSAFFEYFRWFDTSIGTFIEQLLPKKTNFKGMNFVVESHMLERHKLQYQFEDMYLSEDTRAKPEKNILLQLIDGVINKY